MAAVVANTATESDALSTAFFVAGAEASRACVASHSNLFALLFVSAASDRNPGRVALSSRDFVNGELVFDDGSLHWIAAPTDA